MEKGFDELHQSLFLSRLFGARHTFSCMASQAATLNKPQHGQLLYVRPQTPVS
ncbi:MAG: hypothetical protein JST32_02495 [Bacteroidetes bacterium]|nr:hypothetical protein [Bacteroidota bacterium]